MTTDEQRETDRILRDSVFAACQAQDWTRDATLTEFVVVGVLTENQPDEQRLHTRYFTLMSDDRLPQHRVLGLLQQALHYHLT